MIFSVASQKGGTGKTTTSITLAGGLHYAGKRVLLVDLDSQANSSKVLLENYQDLSKEDTVYQTIIERQPLPIHSTALANVDIVPSHILLAEADMELTTARDHREARLKSQLEKIFSNYDHVIIDCPPALSWLTINAFTASDGILVVVAPGYFELDSLGQIQKAIAEVKEYFNPKLSILGFLFTMSDPTLNSKTTVDILRQTYPDLLLNTIIPRNTDVRDAHFNKKDIFSFNPNAPTAHAYKKLIRELEL